MNERAVIGYVNDLLPRGSRTNKSNAEYCNTNKQYWPRQLFLLQFCSENATLKTSQEDLQQELGCDSLPMCRWKGPICFARADAVSAFFKTLAELRLQKGQERAAPDVYVTLNGNNLDQFEMADSVVRRRAKVTKEHVRHLPLSDLSTVLACCS